MFYTMIQKTIFSKSINLFIVAFFITSILFISHGTVKKIIGDVQLDSPKFQQNRWYPGSNGTVTNSDSYTDIELSSGSDEDDIHIDKTEMNLDSIFHETLRHFRSFPQQKLLVEGKPPFYNKSCAPYATLFDIEFDSNWQMLHTVSGSAYIYGAYYDNRSLTTASKQIHGPAVRILGMMDSKLRLATKITYHCQLWFDGMKVPILCPVVDKTFFWKQRKGKLQVFLLACTTPSSLRSKIPDSVSIVVNPCDKATNNLRVQFEMSLEKKDFAVCVKGLDFIHEDNSFKLVEWIELLRILGADKIFLYEFAVHPNASKVLRYYEKTDYVDVTSITLPGGLPNDPGLRHIYLKKRIEDKRTNEMIPYNDCLYRNMNKYKYVALLDSDETPVPLKVDGWKELIKQLRAEKPMDFEDLTSICFRNTYFFDVLMQNRPLFSKVPSFMHELQHVYRSKSHTKKEYATKCMHNTDRVITLHNHFPASCFDNCTALVLDPKDAQLQHYKPDCPFDLRNCVKSYKQDPVFDNNLWRYKIELINRTLDVLGDLGFISKTIFDSWKTRIQNDKPDIFFNHR